jgi:hypothetical protein
MFESCLATDADGRVDSDLAVAKSLGLTSTPSLLLARRTGADLTTIEWTGAGAMPVAAIAAEVERLAPGTDGVHGVTVTAWGGFAVLVLLMLTALVIFRSRWRWRQLSTGADR